MALIVIHLWGKFWMAAWRGRRAMTWITGVVAFGACVVECFTGYLSQQNFDSQWIATNGKDAFNATGVGGVLQRDELRPDVAVAHRAGPDHPGRAGRCAHAAGADARRQPPAAGPRVRWRDRAARKAAAPRTPPVARPDPPVRHPQGGHDRGGDHDRPRGADGRPAVLARRAAGQRAKLGQGRAGGLRQHRGHRTGRDGAAACYGPPYNNGRLRCSRSARSTGRSCSASPSRSTPRRRSCSRRCPSWPPTIPALAAALAAYTSASPASR